MISVLMSIFPDLDYYNSPDDFKCLDGRECGRFPASHGEEADGGAHKSDFVAAMWDNYR